MLQESNKQAIKKHKTLTITENTK